jgi:sugar O-acyltransferase (sialic acid O-acetyltransferase NeuD family)
MDEIILIGGGGHAKVVIDILEERGDYNILGIIAKNKGDGIGIGGYQILGNDNDLQELFNKGVKFAAMGVGGYTNNTLRKRIYEDLKRIGFQVISAIHPTASISRTVLMGEGNVVFSGVVIGPYVRLGNNIIVATGSTIDHDSVLKDHSLISAGVTVGAETQIEEGALLALGSKIISGITICKGALIGAGAVITRNISEPGTYVGIPGKRIK